MPRLAHPKENIIRHLILISTCLGLALVGCAPSPEIVASAMAQTEVARPTATLTLAPSPTHTPTLTPEPPTSTPTETPTSTPDLRIITASPEELACTKRDLPDARNYGMTFLGTFPNPYSNDKVVRSGGTLLTDKLENYVRETRRIDGWQVYYEKFNTTSAGFSVLRCITNRHETAEGAQLAVLKYNDAKIYTSSQYEIIENPEEIVGDISLALSNTWNEDKIHYQLYFSYRNYQLTIIGRGSANLDDLYFIAESMLEKLEDASLGLP